MDINFILLVPASVTNVSASANQQCISDTNAGTVISNALIVGYLITIAALWYRHESTAMTSALSLLFMVVIKCINSFMSSMLLLL